MAFEDYDNYTYIHDDNTNKVIALSTYAGKTVRGIAKCDPRDEFDLEAGKDLAAARCNVKVAKKRLHRAMKKKIEAMEALLEAKRHYDQMSQYLDDSTYAANVAVRELKTLETKL